MLSFDADDAGVVIVVIIFFFWFFFFLVFFWGGFLSFSFLGLFLLSLLSAFQFVICIFELIEAR